MMDINLYQDFNNIENNIITNPLHLFLQEIELAIKLGPQELWGFRYSVDIKNYVFNQYITLNQIQNELSTFIANNCSQAQIYPFNITAELVDIEGEIILYIKAEITDINSNQENNIYTQKFILGL